MITAGGTLPQAAHRRPRRLSWEVQTTQTTQPPQALDQEALQDTANGCGLLLLQAAGVCLQPAVRPDARLQCLVGSLLTAVGAKVLQDTQQQ
jgi:hypothetical protein